MLRRKLLFHYRLVRETLTAVITIGAALVASYLILRVGLW